MKTPNPIHPTRNGSTLMEVLFVGFVAVILMLLFNALPIFSRTAPKGRMTDSVSNAKQIMTALKMYAGDNDGKYPFTRVDGTPLGPGDFSNRAFEHLMPKYSSTKKLFFNKTSAWCRNPAGDRSGDSYLLKRGQNDWNYVVGLAEDSDGRWPVIATATASATSLTYSNVKTAKGGVWEGNDAVVGYVDGSVRVEGGPGMDSTDKTKTFPKRPDNGANMFIATPEWLGPGSFILAPE